MSIHERAIVSGDAIIGPGVEIGPYAIIEAGVEIGPGVRIGPHAHVCTGARLGEGVVLHMGAVVGHEPQDLSYKGQPTRCEIGAGTIIREYATVHRATREGTATVVGRDCFLMVGSHVAHDCRVGDRVIVANGAIVAGHVQVGERAFVSGNVVIHQFCRVGALAMIGGWTGINKDVPPYMMARGPSQVRYVNLVGMRRAGFAREVIASIRSAFKLLYRSELNTSQALAAIRELGSSPELDLLIDFIASSKRGICGARRAGRGDDDGGE